MPETGIAPDQHIVELPGCGEPASVRIDVHERDERQPKLIKSVYVCKGFEGPALDAIRVAGLLPLTGPAKGSAVCGQFVARVVAQCPAVTR
ncbi:hypothetical protein ACQEVC_45365 [Plantactinospora sp. CA-294935]|uniref:hypothetical protein n=1 Tax=Plantactinospora sp. CA-294935 TaxID=3240012 RepID=UPI003D8BCC02